MKFKALTPNLIVDDVNAAMAYYENVLGFNKVASVPEEGTLDFAIVKSGDVSLMLQSKESYNQENLVFKEMPVGGTFVLYIDVEGIEKLYHQLKDKTNLIVDMHATFYGTNEFSIKDVNGYVLTFSEDKK